MPDPQPARRETCDECTRSTPPATAIDDETALALGRPPGALFGRTTTSRPTPHDLGAAMRAPVQLALDDLDLTSRHGHHTVHALDDGYRGRCYCGWVGPECDTKPKARGTVSSHIARTAQGAQLVATLRHARGI